MQTPVDLAMTALLAAENEMTAAQSNMANAVSAVQTANSQLASAQAAETQAYTDMKAAIYNLNATIQAAHD